MEYHVPRTGLRRWLLGVRDKIANLMPYLVRGFIAVAGVLAVAAATCFIVGQPAAAARLVTLTIWSLMIAISLVMVDAALAPEFWHGQSRHRRRY